jgi:ABC-type phosphate transport system permease subunit
MVALSFVGTPPISIMAGIYRAEYNTKGCVGHAAVCQ